MKTKLFLLLFLILPFFSMAQIEKGSFILESGIRLSGEGLSYANAFSETSLISFSSRDFYAKDVITKEEKSWYPYHQISFSIAPRVGYSLFRNFAAGVDFKYSKKTLTYEVNDYKDKYKTNLYGLFMRKYFGKAKILPFAEADAGFGKFKSNTDNTSPGGGYYMLKIPKNVYYISGAIGASYQISSKFRINLLAKIQKTTEKPINTENYSTSETRTVNIDSGFVLSFSYLLNKKTTSKLE